MDISHYKRYEPIFGVWHITRLIGEGSFGKVFEMEREDFGITYKAALKAITIPNSQSEVDDLMTEMTNVDSVRTYYSSFVRELVEESALMSKLKGNSNVVSYEDHQVMEHKEGVGWDILIRMELLTPLNRYIKEHTITRQDIIKLGIDMCKALDLCQKYNIIHRDLKPENIFISDSGDFKLGDFGIARTIEKTTGGLSKKGTYNYMAPEVYKGQAYGSTVDIYSLGVVLYRLLNENRTPFLPAYPAPITHKDRDNALAKRFSGAPLPHPANGDGRLGEIVLKACAYEPKDRYSSPAQMRQELEAILYNKEEAPYIYPEGDQVEQRSVEYIQTGHEPPVTPEDATQRDATQFGEAPEQTVSDFGTVRTKCVEQIDDRNFDRKNQDPVPAQNKTKNHVVPAIVLWLLIALFIFEMLIPWDQMGGNYICWFILAWYIGWIAFLGSCYQKSMGKIWALMPANLGRILLLQLFGSSMSVAFAALTDAYDQVEAFASVIICTLMIAAIFYKMFRKPFGWPTGKTVGIAIAYPLGIAVLAALAFPYGIY